MTDYAFILRALAAIALAGCAALYLIDNGIDIALAIFFPVFLAVYLLYSGYDEPDEP